TQHAGHHPCPGLGSVALVPVRQPVHLRRLLRPLRVRAGRGQPHALRPAGGGVRAGGGIRHRVQRHSKPALLPGGVGEPLRDRRHRDHALPRRLADPLGANGLPAAAQRAPVRPLLHEVLRLRRARHLAALDAAAHPRGPDDGDVLEVSRAHRAGELPRNGDLDGALSAGPGPGALAAPPGGGGGDRGLRAPGRVPHPLRAARATPPELQPAGNGTLARVIAMGLGTYLRNIKDAVATIADGMAVTASHMIRKPVTIEYPDRLPDGVRVQGTLPFRYRGILEADLEVCTACLACERACPIDCIVIDAEKDKTAARLVMTRFDINIAKCMSCGLCSEPCPTGSIHHTPEFEGADYSLESMVRHFVKAPVVAYKPKKGGETDPEIAPILERGMRYVGEFASPDAPDEK